MSLPSYLGEFSGGIAPGESYMTPEKLAQSNASNVAAINTGGSNLTNQLVANLAGGLHGELPPDVKQLLQQQAAQNGVGSGTSGSDFANYQGLRTLGLTSLGRMQHTEDSLINPLLGYRPIPYANPYRPYSPPAQGYQGGGGGFENTTPHYNVGPIQGGGGSPHGSATTLPTYGAGAPSAATSTGNILNDLLSKYGPLGNSGSSPMGSYGGSPLDMSGLNTVDQGYGYGNDQDLAPGTSAQDLSYADAGADNWDFSE